MHKPFTFLKRGSVWYVRFRDPETGNRLIPQSTGETRRAAAEVWALTRMPKTKEAERATKTFGDFARTFFEWGLCDWIARQHANNQPFTWPSAQIRRGHVTKYLLPAFESRQLASITGKNIAIWLAGLELASATRSGILGSLSIIMDDAVLDGLIERNPCDAVPSPGRGGKERSVLTLEERTALFPSDHGELARIWGDPQRATAFKVLATSGIRSGELRALRWRHFYRDKGLLIEGAVKHGGEIAGTKSGNVRAVRLPGSTRAALDWWRSLSRFAEDGDLIFSLARGKPVGQNWLTRTLAFALAQAGVNVGDRNISVHSFRHGFNTMARTTLPAEQLRLQLGHTSEKMTQHYDHPKVDELFARTEGAAPVIEAMFDSKPS